MTSSESRHSPQSVYFNLGIFAKNKNSFQKFSATYLWNKAGQKYIQDVKDQGSLSQWFLLFVGEAVNKWDLSVNFWSSRSLKVFWIAIRLLIVGPCGHMIDSVGPKIDISLGIWGLDRFLIFDAIITDSKVYVHEAWKKRWRT